MRRLEIAVNIAILLTCVVLLGTLGARFVGPSTPSANRARPATLESGQPIPGFAGVQWNRADRTLLLVVSAACHFCAESMPFYRGLSNHVETGTSRKPQLLLVTTDARDTAKGYIENNGLKVSGVILVSAETEKDLKIPGTPTLILVDSKGVVINVWVGVLNKQQETDVVTQLFVRG